MPRTTYADRFEALLAKDYIPTRDRQFIESLYTYYKSKGSLTAGRRTYFQRLEAQYAKAQLFPMIWKTLLLKCRLCALAATMQDEWTPVSLTLSFSRSKLAKLFSSKGYFERQNRSHDR